MNKVTSREMLVPNIYCMNVDAPDIAAEVQPGQFVIIRGREDGERIPISVADWDRESGSITVVFLEVGASTSQLTQIKQDDHLPTCAGPLGIPTQVGKFGTVVCVCGCYGIASIFPICRALKKHGNTVITVVEGRSSYLLYWLDKLAGVSDRLVKITRDGSTGKQGHVNSLLEVFRELPAMPDRVVVNGCTFLMKRVSDITKPFGIKTIVSLNPIMIDGTGMCGVCRVTINGTTKFACVDGPDFDGHEVDWQELLARRKAYIAEETDDYMHSDSLTHKGRCSV